ncbi:MAG: chorismate mutase [Prolixibacteraceae bacterium]|nr:chorismate mutase [Prolixibacteraceae bacterium]
MSPSKQGINFPHECTSKEEIRAEIDRLDRQIIDLFAERLQYVRAIVKFKQTADDIVAKARYDEVISSRGQWAAEKGLSAEVFESIYCKLLNYSICEEHKLANETKK